MSFIDEEDDARVAALEKFAGSAPGSRNDVVEVATANMLQSMDRVYGAQRVAMRRDERAMVSRLQEAADVAGEMWYYSWQVEKKDGTKEWIEGPSIKLTDDLVRLFGNCDLDTRSVDLGDSWLFLSRFIDLENGYSRTRPYQQRKGQRTSGKMDADRARDIAYQIGCSKCERNVVVHALPFYTNQCFEWAKGALIRKIDGKPESYRATIIKRLTSNGIDVRRAERVIGREAPQWVNRDMARLVSSIRSCEDNMANWDETFPPLTTTAADGTVADRETGEVIENGKPATDGKSALDELAGETSSETRNTGVSASSDGKAAGPGTSRDKDQPADPAATKPTPVDLDKKPPAASIGEGAKSADKKEPVPTNADEYKVYFESWFRNEANPSKALERWNEEKKLRNSCRVPEAQRDEWRALVEAKVTGK